MLLPSRDIKFSIIAARKIVTSSNNVNTKENGWFIRIPAITNIGTTNNAIWVPEPAAIPIDNSILPFLARTMALLCSAAFPTIPMIMAPTKSSPKPNCFAVTSTEPTNISLTVLLLHTQSKEKK